jgi:hypothetical protein
MNLNVALRAVLISGVATLGLATHAAAQVTGVEFVGEVEDSLSYLVYWYELTNPSASAWAIAALQLDISASSGTPTNLPASGDIVIVPGFGAEQPHAEVGPIAPTGWRSIQSPIARLRWAPPNTEAFSGDSVAPGASKSGFGLRSTYLPGINSIEAFPTIESCCREPTDTTGGEFIYAMPSQLAVTGSTIAPRYTPEEVTLDLLQSQLTAICDDPLWLDDSQLCTEFGDLLDMAEDEEGDGNFYGAAAVLNHLLDRIGDEEAAFDPNGYWLMSLNVAQAYENVQTVAESAAFLFHFRTTPDTIVAPDGRVMSWSPQTAGDVEGSVAASTSKTFYWVRELDSAYTIADGTWAVQLDLFELESAGGDLSLRDIQIQRYSSSGSLLESKYLHQGEVMSLPTGEVRVPVAGALTGWSAHSAGDLSVVSFTLQNGHASQSASYAIRAGVQHSDWGGSWLSQPR